MSRIFIEDYKGYTIKYNDNIKMYLVDTDKIIYFRPTLHEIKFLIDNLEKEYF